jgi:hypothetical protein
MTHAEQAKATLVHYFEQLTLRCGMMWRPEQIQEVESIVDNILRSMDARLNPVPDCYPHVWATTDGGAKVCVKCGSRRTRDKQEVVKDTSESLYLICKESELIKWPNDAVAVKIKDPAAVMRDLSKIIGQP